MIVYRKKFLKFSEVWFEDHADNADVDVVEYINMSIPPANRCAYEESYTLQVFLQADTEQALINRMDKNTRYEIRRAESKDQLDYKIQTLSECDNLDEFLNCYQLNVANHENGPRLDRSRFNALISSGQLDMSVVRDIKGSALTWHVHLRGNDVARLFLSASIFSTAVDHETKNLCGRANRLHHWLDMLHYRKCNFDYYDFGGYYNGESDPKKSQINRFKSGFGGEVICRYNYLKPNTWLGKSALLIHRLRGR